MSYYSIEIQQQAALQTTNQQQFLSPISDAIDPITIGRNNTVTNQSAPNYEQVMQMIDRTISQMKVYVVESEITQTQNAIKTVVEQASF